MSRKERLLKMLETQPTDAFLNFGLAMELLKEGDAAGAIERFNLVIRYDPDYTAAHHHKGNTLIAQGRTAEAAKILEEGIEAAQRIGNRHAEREMRELRESLPRVPPA